MANDQERALESVLLRLEQGFAAMDKNLHKEVETVKVASIPNWLVPLIGIFAATLVSIAAFLLNDSSARKAEQAIISGKIDTYQAQNDGRYQSLKERLDDLVDGMKDMKRGAENGNGILSKIEMRVTNNEGRLDRLTKRVDIISRDQTDMLESLSNSIGDEERDKR